MRELLDALDELADPDPTRRGAVLASLARYRVEVERRTRTLQERLAGAYALRDALETTLSSDWRTAAQCRGLDVLANAVLRSRRPAPPRCG